MWCQNGQRPKTHRVSCVANDQNLVFGKVGDLASILRILGIAVGNHASNLILDCLWKILDGTMSESCALTTNGVS